MVDAVLKTYFDASKPVGLDTLREAQDDLCIYTAGQARLEIKPIEYH